MQSCSCACYLGTDFLYIRTLYAAPRHAIACRQGAFVPLISSHPTSFHLNGELRRFTAHDAVCRGRDQPRRTQFRRNEVRCDEMIDENARRVGVLSNIRRHYYDLLATSDGARRPSHRVVDHTHSISTPTVLLQQLVHDSSPAPRLSQD